MSDYIVEMRNVTKKFPGIIANDNVTLQIKKGEIYAILGENGAGKSTLMSMLFGMYEPDEGEIFIRGKQEKIVSPKYATELNIGMVHQHFKLVENYTVTENIIMGIEPVTKMFNFFPKVDLKTADKKVLELSQKHGLEVEPTKKIAELNVSIQQRVEILKMLYREAEILIFDEPTAVLTPQEIDYFLEIIKGLRSEGKTIILITHKLEEIKQVTDRCAVLRRGKLIEVVETAKTSTREMSKLMVGRDVSLTMNKKDHAFSDVVLSLKNVTVENQDGFKIVNDVSFDVKGGEIFAIAGVSGNGQVEIGDAITGLLETKTGEISLNGKDLTNLTIRQRTLAGISYIPEDRHSVGLVLDYSLEDNLMLKNYFQEPYCAKGLLNRLAFKETSTRFMENYDIRSGQGLKTIVRSMSGGNQQKAIIAREIEQDNPLIIFVQPTRGLDVGAIESIHKQILAERDKGKAILLISLELEEVMNLADTIGVIYSGQIQTIKATKEMTSSEVGEYMMGVKGK